MAVENGDIGMLKSLGIKVGLRFGSRRVKVWTEVGLRFGSR